MPLASPVIGDVLPRVHAASVTPTELDWPSTWVDRAGRARNVFFVVEPDRAALRELARRIDAGELRSVVGDVLPLERGREAFEAKRRAGMPGKVVLRIAP